MDSSTPSRRPTALAVASLLLSLAPLVALALVRIVSLTASSLPQTVVTVLSATVYAGSFIGSLAAVITGVLALRRASQSPSQPAVRAAAVAGIVLGVAGMLILIAGAVFVGAILHACSTNPANCG